MPAMPTWHAMPPEINTSRLMVGAGSAPMLQAAAAWESLALSLEGQAGELAASLSQLAATWTGAASEQAIASMTPAVMWLRTTSMQAHKRSLQAAAQAAAHTTALAATPPIPEIEQNHITQALLQATNFFGINAVPIALNEEDYFVRMWNQAAVAMDSYNAETLVNTTFEPIPPLPPITTPGVANAVGAAGDSRAMQQPENQFAQQGLQMVSQMASQVGQLPQQAGQMLQSPMQLLTQPLQQVSQLFSQFGQMGGQGQTEGLAGGAAGGRGAQIGLLGASPFSSHPLAGGGGPSVGAGMVRAASLPGAGGLGARTPMLAGLLGEGASGLNPAAVAAGAGAGSAALGLAPVSAAGAGGVGAPIGGMGQRGTSGGVRKALEGPEALEYDSAEEDADDW